MIGSGGLYSTPILFYLVERVKAGKDDGVKVRRRPIRIKLGCGILHLAHPVDC